MFEELIDRKLLVEEYLSQTTNTLSAFSFVNIFAWQDFFEFDRTHKTILVTNNKPVISENNEAVWRRLRLIPFDVTVPEAKRDKD